MKYYVLVRQLLDYNYELEISLSTNPLSQEVASMHGVDLLL